MRLTNEEKETIITFDETPADAIVFTYSKTWQKQIEQKLGIQPTMNNGFGGREYHVPKQRIRMPQPKRVFSSEHRRKLANKLAQGRRQKSIISAGNTAASGAKTVEKTKPTKTIAAKRQGQKPQ